MVDPIVEEDMADIADRYDWYPSESFKGASNWQRFVDSEGLPDYPALARKASEDPHWFWDALIRFLDFRFMQPYSSVLDLSKGLEWPTWCAGGTTNMTLTAKWLGPCPEGMGPGAVDYGNIVVDPSGMKK